MKKGNKKENKTEGKKVTIKETKKENQKENQKDNKKENHKENPKENKGKKQPEDKQIPKSDPKTKKGENPENTDKTKQPVQSQEHIEEKARSTKRHKTKSKKQIEYNITTNNDSNNPEITVEVTVKEEKPKVLVEIKPRENYLKDKIEKMNFNNNLLTSINKDLGYQLESVRQDLKEDKVDFNEKPKNINKFINKSYDGKLHKNPFEIMNMKNKYKLIKDLKDERDILSLKLMRITENEKLMENKEFINVIDPNSKFAADNGKQKLRQLKEQKAEIIRKLNILENKMKNLVMSTEEIQKKKEDNLKTFLDNFERDKEIVEARAKKYYKESKERRVRVAKDMKEIINKQKQIMESEKKEAQEKKEKMMLDLMRQEKLLEAKRAKEIKAKALEFKPYINEIPENNKHKCLFVQKFKKYMEKEDSIQKKENLRRKMNMKSITRDEIEEFGKALDEKMEKYVNEQDEKNKKLADEWKSRKKLLPTYVSPSYEYAEAECNKIMADQEAVKAKKDELKQNKINYGNQIKETHQPVIDKKLQKQRLELIDSLDYKKNNNRKNLSSAKDRNKNKIILKKNNSAKKKKLNWELKVHDVSPLSDFETSSIIEKNLVKKPKRLIVSTQKSPKKLPILPKDYLRELAEEKEKKNTMSRKENLTDGSYNFAQGQKKWEKIIKDNETPDPYYNMDLIKEKAGILEDEAMKAEKMIKYGGGMGNSPELRQKMSNLLLDSIGAKLSYLNQIHNK